MNNINQENLEKRRIICAAVRSRSTSKVVIGLHYYDTFMLSAMTVEDFPSYEDRGERGFIDQHGVFLTPTEAWKVAEAAGQILFKGHSDLQSSDTLGPSNLYWR
jgi:hypothetical protein